MAAGANADMCADTPSEMLPAPVVDVVAPVIGPTTATPRTQAAALHSFRSGYGRVVQEGLGQVEIQHQIGTDAACGDLGRVAHHQRDAQGIGIHEALIEVAVVTKEKSLVTGVGDQGVLSLTGVV